MQEAFRDCHGLQCGFCTPGFVMSVTAFLRDHPDPTDDEIREGLVGQPLPLHRLPGHPAGGPPGRRRRVRRGAVVTAISGNGATRYAGARINRVEDARLLTGRGTFVDDISLPGMLHACFVRSPFARAAIRSIDTSAALAAPGVRFVFTAADLNPDVKEQWHTSIGPLSPETPRPPLAEGEVRFVGDPVALVVADDRYLAEDAAELVDVDYEPLPAVVDYREAADATDLVHQAHGSNVITSLDGLPLSAMEDTLASAAHVVSETIYQQAYAAVPMEGRGLVVDCSGVVGDMTIYSATQSPHEVRSFCSRLLGLPEHRIRVIMRDTGGGFGQKILVQRDEMCVMLAAPKVGAPLKWIEDRRENLLAAGKARHEHADLTMAFDDEGAILAAHIDYTSDCGAYPTPWPLMTTAVVGMLFPGPYRVPLAGFATKAMYTNTAGPHRVPRAVAVRDVGPRGAARHRRPADADGPGRAAAAQPASPGRAALRQPERHDLRPHLARTRPSSRPSRCSTTTRSVPSRPRPAGVGRYLGVGSRPTSSRPPRASATTAPRRPPSASSRPGG